MRDAKNRLENAVSPVSASMIGRTITYMGNSRTVADNAAETDTISRTSRIRRKNSVIFLISRIGEEALTMSNR